MRSNTTASGSYALATRPWYVTVPRKCIGTFHVNLQRTPDQINYDINNHLVLNNGDTLNVGAGGTVSGITFLPGSNLNMKGGTATDIIINGVFEPPVSGTLVDTTLAGGGLNVLAGTVNGVTFEGSQNGLDPNSPTFIDVLAVPASSLEGTLTFAGFDVAGSYKVEIDLLAEITSIDAVGGTLTVNFASHPSVAYQYRGAVQFTLNGNLIEAQIPQFGSPFSPETAGTIVYTAEFGMAPSATELTILNQFTQAQFDFGQKIGVMDPSIYAFQALGVALASGPHFQDTFGPTNALYPVSTVGDVHFVDAAYASVFGHAGTAAQIQLFVDQLDSFEALYSAAGTFGSASNIDLLARGAIYGQMLGIEHESGPVGIEPGGTTFTAPPNHEGLGVAHGDILNVDRGGLVRSTILSGGVVNVNAGGRTVLTHIFGGVENVIGVSENPILYGGVENVVAGGTVVGNIIFGDESGGGVLKLSDPTQLKGIIEAAGQDGPSLIS
jgi:autotransporter passenger strand-loop-strand repeat protein